MKKVSVIVPVYNVKAYLNRCVQSILNQTEQNIQIILVDDGSTDGSSSLCDDLAKADNRIRVIHKENGGLSSARNCGLQNANGDFVCFIDSDDVISPYFVEHLLFLVAKYACDISVGRYVCFNETEPDFDTKDIDIEIVEGKKAINQLFGDSYVNATIACNKLYKRSLFDDLKYPEGLINEDEALAYRLYYKANKVAFSSNIIYGYFMRANSITKSRFSKKNFDFLQIAWDRCIFFENNNEERYYHLFLKIYCWTLLDFAQKTKKVLCDSKKSKELIKEFKAKSRTLIASPYISKGKRIVIKVFRVFPSLYYLFKAMKSKEK